MAPLPHSNPPLIGICAHAPGAGKTTAADFLVDLGFTRIPFAKPLKDLSTFLLFQLGVSATRAHYYIYDPAGKEEPIPELGFDITGRHMQRTLGTEWGRQLIHPEIWLRCWRRAFHEVSAEGRAVVVDDVRFPNEADLILRLGGELWLIEHPTGEIQQGVHASEGGLLDYPHFSARLSNRRTLDDLRDLVRATAQCRFPAWSSLGGGAVAGAPVLDEPSPPLRQALAGLLQSLRRLRRS